MVSQIGTDALSPHKPSLQVCAACAGREAEAAVLQFLAGRRWRTGGGAQQDQQVTVTVPRCAKFSHIQPSLCFGWEMILVEVTVSNSESNSIFSDVEPTQLINLAAQWLLAALQIFS